MQSVAALACNSITVSIVDSLYFFGVRNFGIRIWGRIVREHSICLRTGENGLSGLNGLLSFEFMIEEAV